MTHGVPSVDASIRLLSLVAAGEADGPIQAVARRLAISNSSCFRILRTLKNAGWVNEQPSSSRSIGSALMQLARADDAESRLIEASRGPILALAMRRGLACKLSARRGMQAVTLDRAEPGGSISLSSPAGAVFSLCLGSSGAVLASDLAGHELDALLAGPHPAGTWRFQTPADFRARVGHARRHGWAVDRGSYHPHVHSISRAVRSTSGVIGVVTLLGMAEEFEPARLRTSRRQLDACVRQISAALDSAPPPPRRKGKRR